jgi:hypothetical protein
MFVAGGEYCGGLVFESALNWNRGNREFELITVREGGRLVLGGRFKKGRW